LFTLIGLVSVQVQAESDSSALRYETYVDVGYVASNREPSDGSWQGKSSTATLNEVNLHLAMANLAKAATAESRWGFELGLQTGEDSKGLVTSAPPPANEPLSNADNLRHLYRANVSYLFGERGNLKVTGGLINSYIGYESYLAIQNLNYTRAYMLDFVPYFLLGAQADYSVTDTLDLSLVVAGGWNYLTQPNHTSSYGLQAAWQLLPQVRVVQNLYYGPDQEDTGMEFWRFFSDSIIEWKNDRFAVAAAFDVGTEKQAEVPGKPRYDWMAGSVWLGWHIDGPWTLGVRPEIYRDPDGLGTGSVQTIQACTGTLEYLFSPIKANTMVIALEYRYDRSTGSDGGFYNGEDNELVPDQHQLLFSLMWAFGP
jgi:hypothetical protein